MNRGLTVLEILLAVSIIALLAFFSLGPFFNFRDGQILDNTASEIISIINEARNSTLSSLNDASYSVRVEEFRVVLFEGATFDNGDPSNEEYNLDDRVHISEIDLAGGVSDINFERLTGDTYDQGSLTISLQNGNASSTRKILIDRVGVVERTTEQ